MPPANPSSTRSITGPDEQARALAAVAMALAEADRYEHAITMASQAETVMASQAETMSHLIGYQGLQAFTLAAVAEVLARAGQHERAATVARSITAPGPAGVRAGGSS